jgi:hypothetical protein
VYRWNLLVALGQPAAQEALLARASVLASKETAGLPGAQSSRLARCCRESEQFAGKCARTLFPLMFRELVAPQWVRESSRQKPGIPGAGKVLDMGMSRADSLLENDNDNDRTCR